MPKTKIWTLWSDGHVNEEETKLLRAISEEIPTPLREEDKKLIETLLVAFLERDDAVGLAAPQIGVCKRAIAFKVKGFEEGSRKGNPQDCEILINPRVTQTRGEEEIMAEGCLSCPEINVEISRPTEIKVRALDTRGNKINKRYTGFVARIVQHEIDHLNGKLIVDYDGAILVPREKRPFFEQIFNKKPSEPTESTS